MPNILQFKKMIQIGDIVQINDDLPNSPLKRGILGVIVHQHSESAYELEPVAGFLLDETFAVTATQIKVVWSISDGSQTCQIKSR